MASYIIRRLLLMIPTLLGILMINFLVIQAAPGGPVERTLAQLQGHGGSTMLAGTGGDMAVSTAATSGPGYRGSQGLPPELIAEIEKQYGFDQPASTRF